MNLRVSSALLGESFAAETTGPLSRLIRYFVSLPPLSEAMLRAQLSSQSLFQPQISLLAPAAQAAAIAVFPWTIRDDPGTPLEATPPTPAPGAAK